MPIFNDKDEVDRYLGGIFDRAVIDPELAPKLKAAGVQVGMNYTDPDSRMVIDFSTLTVYRESDENAVEPGIEMYMKSDDAHKFWLGRLNLPLAIARKQVRVKGPVAQLLKFMPLAAPLYVTYEEILKADGRDDLLAA